MPSSYAAEIMAECLRHVGLRESPKGSNKGKALAEALDLTPWQPGQAWCLYLAQAVLRNVYKAHNRTLPDHLLPLNGGCTAYRIAVENKKPSAVIRGMVSQGAIFMLLDSTGDEFHAGICCGVADFLPGHMVTFEGNVNSTGSPEGWETLIRVRPINRTLILTH